MARTRGDAADPVDVVEEEIVLGPEEPETEDEPQVDEDGNPIEDEPELDEDGNPIETEPEDVAAEPAPRRSGGGSQTIKAQRRARQEAEQRAAQLERELAEARGFQQGMQARAVDPQAAARAEQEFYASLELMAPAEAYRQLMARGQAQVGTALQQIEFRANERADKQAYDIACRSSPAREKFRAQVEQVLASERAQNRNPDRETIYKWLLGDEMDRKMSRASPAQRNGAARRVAAQRTQPTGARGDVAARGRGARLVPGTPEHDDWLVNEGIRSGHNVFE
jgi:hypothetical protein